MNGKEKVIHTFSNKIPQVDKWGVTRCSKLDLPTGNCNIHGKHPFSCDFEILRVVAQENIRYLNNRFFGRGWSYTKVVDGTKGAACELYPATEEGREETIRKLKRLQEWTDYFELETHLPKVIDWLQEIPLDHKKNAVFYPEPR